MALARQARFLFPSLWQRQASCSQSIFAPYSTEATVIRDGEIGEVSGVPAEHLKRKVYIYVPARTASQQGGSNTENWRIRFDSTQKWENPLMGWTSTGDPLAHVGDSALYFTTREAAVDFARRHGWEYTVMEPKQMKKKPKAYADNFKWKGPPAAEES